MADHPTTTGTETCGGKDGSLKNPVGIFVTPRNLIGTQFLPLPLGGFALLQPAAIDLE